MSEKPKERESAGEKSLLMSQVLQLDAVTRLLMKKGVFTEGELFRELRKVESEYESKKKFQPS